MLQAISFLLQSCSLFLALRKTFRQLANLAIFFAQNLTAFFNPHTEITQVAPGCRFGKCQRFDVLFAFAQTLLKLGELETCFRFGSGNCSYLLLELRDSRAKLFPFGVQAEIQASKRFCLFLQA